MAQAIKDIKNLQQLKGAEAVRGEFYLVANRGSSKQFVLGYTQEGTFSVERDYRNADQNQTVSGVKGLVFLDSATVTFETQSLQLSDGIFAELKGFNVEEVTDSDGSKYQKLTENAFVAWDKYIDTLELLFEFTDGRVGVIKMFNVIDKSAESIVFNRTDDVLVSVMFEATIDENDSDEILPYEMWIEGESDEVIIAKSKSLLEQTPFMIGTNYLTEIPSQALAKLTEHGYKDVLVDATGLDDTDIVGTTEGTFIQKIEGVTIQLNAASDSVTIGATTTEDIPATAPSYKKVEAK